MNALFTSESYNGAKLHITKIEICIKLKKKLQIKKLFLNIYSNTKKKKYILTCANRISVKPSKPKTKLRQYQIIIAAKI